VTGDCDEKDLCLVGSDSGTIWPGSFFDGRCRYGCVACADEGIVRALMVARWSLKTAASVACSSGSILLVSA
jgi:hypothetical protein